MRNRDSVRFGAGRGKIVASGIKRRRMVLDSVDGRVQVGHDPVLPDKQHNLFRTERDRHDAVADHIEVDQLAACSEALEPERNRSA